MAGGNTWGKAIAAGWRGLTNPGVTKTGTTVVKEVLSNPVLSLRKPENKNYHWWFKRLTQEQQDALRKLPILGPKLSLQHKTELEVLVKKIYDDYVALTIKVYQPGGGGWTQSIAREQHARMREYYRLSKEIIDNHN